MATGIEPLGGGASFFAPLWAKAPVPAMAAAAVNRFLRVIM